MCGRYTLTADWGDVANEFGLPEPLGAVAGQGPRYNIAPLQSVPVVALKADRVTRVLAMLRWGLVPYWAADLAAGPKPINLRAETVAWKFGEHLREKRCLIPADGFYEWKTEGRKKRPHWFTVDGGRVFAFAGLWDAWGEAKSKLVTCTTLTTTPNSLVAQVHDRMPVIVPREFYAEWLDPATPEPWLKDLLVPFPAERWRCRRSGLGSTRRRMRGRGASLWPAAESGMGGHSGTEGSGDTGHRVARGPLPTPRL